MEAVLALEDGTVFRGVGFGSPAERTGEIVFNTSLTGYQEILTDPSYAGQIVVMTYPHIGNYGINRADIESRRPFAEGFVVREYSGHFSNWRAESGLSDYLKLYGIPGISEIDTRALVRHIRVRGAMRACLSTETLDADQAVAKARAAPSMIGLDLASVVTCDHPFVWNDLSPTIDPGGQSSQGISPVILTQGDSYQDRFHVVAYDFGIKFNILRSLQRRGCSITVVPAHTAAEDVLAMQPDGVFLSNGPGDPEPLESIVAQIRKLMGRIPIFGICLGHQLLGLAFGGRTYKLKFGHRGGNQPVKNLLSGKVEITSHNHGFAVDAESVPVSDVELTHINLNDQTLEGMRHRSLPIFSVQYHPEASPGPHDAAYLFDEFIGMMTACRRESARER
jgi:carbamoyl-phosphate synthase small subunit